MERNNKIERINTGTIYYEDLYPLGFCLLISAIAMFFLFLWPTKEVLTSFWFWVLMGVGIIMIAAFLFGLLQILKLSYPGFLDLLLFIPILVWVIVEEYIFGPTWRSKNKDRRIKAIRELRNQRTLRHIATNEFLDGAARAAAITKLDDEALIIRIAGEESNDQVIKAAINRIAEIQTLLVLTREANSVLARQLAEGELILRAGQKKDLSRLTDLYWDLPSGVRKTLVETLQDQAILANIILKEKDRDVLEVAIQKLEDKIVLLEFYVRTQGDWNRRELRASAAKKLIGPGERLCEPIVAALQNLNGKVSITAFISDLKSDTPAIRRVAAFALKALKWQPTNQDETVVYYYISLGDFDKCKSLGKDAVGPLLTELCDTSTPSSVKSEIAQALARMQPESATSALAKAAAQFDLTGDIAARALASIGLSAVPYLIKALTAASSSVARNRIIKHLTVYGEDAAQPLIDKLESTKSPGVFEALTALGKAAAPHIANTMCDSSRHWQVRDDCCQLLYKIGYTPGEKKQAAMYHALRHDFKKCEQIGASAVGPLIETLEHLYEKKYDEHQRESVCYSLGQINDVSAVDCLVKVLKNDDNNKVRKAAALALKNIDYHPENDETSALFFIAQGDYVKCAELGVPGIEYLVNWLQHSSYGSDETCRSIANALLRCGDRDVVDTCIEKLESSNTRSVCEFLIRVLGWLGDVRGIRPLVSIMEEMPNHVEDISERDGMFFSTHGFYITPGVMTDAIERLMMSVKLSEVDENDLRALSGAGPFKYSYSFTDRPDKIEYDTYRSSKTTEYSCEKIRSLAKEELKHRGLAHI